MASGRKKTGAKTPASSEGALVPPTRQSGIESATGKALAAETKEIPSGAERGNKNEIQGGTPKPDAEGPKNSGAQTQPAVFTSNGQVPHGFVGSPTGPVAVGTVARDADHAQELIQKNRDDQIAYNEKRWRGATQQEYLSEKQVAKMSRPDVKALAVQRGYKNFPDAGTRATRAAFMAAQDKDETLQKSK